MAAHMPCLATGAALDQPFGNRQHDEGDDEQHQAEGEQRGDMQAGIGLAELVGQRRGDRGCPGANRLPTMRLALPMTKVTAMVSPSARPRPSMMPPMTPTRV
jgi:hypothetical protein